ncbi:costars family protein ABRACL-like [Mizuhopecten yessoensis]|nr:costars family protein ABRACL-like [Mizuhopecten yessoensis]
MNVSHEVSLLVEELKRLGDNSRNADGNCVVKFGTLFEDDKCANMFEALVGTLRAAKKKKYIKYEGEMLLHGPHNNVEIELLQENVE